MGFCSIWGFKGVLLFSLLTVARGSARWVQGFEEGIKRILSRLAELKELPSKPKPLTRHPKPETLRRYQDEWLHPAGSRMGEGGFSMLAVRG